MKFKGVKDEKKDIFMFIVWSNVTWNYWMR